MRTRLPAAVVPLLAVVAVPALVALRLGSDGGGVFAAAWSFAVVAGAATTAVVWWSLRTPAAGADDDARRAAVERALVLAVPVVVVLLVASPWVLTAFGRHARDTGVGSLVLLALATVPYAPVAVVSRAAALGGRVRAAIGPPAVALVVSVVVGWVAMPVIGVLGMAFGWLLGWSGVAAAVVLRSRSVITRPGAVTTDPASR